jgi:CheY-like chemotaxis protein
MRGQHILVVDDNLDARESLAEVLEIAGYEVEKAENGKIALDMLVAHPAALVLLDLMMPVMDGWQVVEAMRGDRELSQVPVVIVSASMVPPPDGLPVLRKPAPVDHVLSLVREGLDGSLPR